MGGFASAMTQINPFVGSVSQTGGVQRQQSADKDRQMRRAADVEKNAGLSSDRFEHAVESAEALPEIHDEQKNDAKKRRPPHKQPEKQQTDENEEPGLDLTA
jgi:hypothetical protein